MTDYAKHTRAAADCMRSVIIVVAIGIVLIVAFSCMVGARAK